MKRARILIPLILALGLLAGPPSGAAAQEAGDAGLNRCPGPFRASFFIGPLLGLDQLFRGGEAGLQCGIAPALLFRSAAEGDRAGLLAAGAGADIAWDSALAYWRFDYCAYIALGPVLRIECGGELGLDGGTIALPDGRGSCQLTALAFPSRFGLVVRLAEIRRFGGFCLSLKGKLGWAAYSAAVQSGAAAGAELSGLAGFAAGLEAGFFMELLWEQ